MRLWKGKVIKNTKTLRRALTKAGIASASISQDDLVEILRGNQRLFLLVNPSKVSMIDLINLNVAQPLPIVRLRREAFNHPLDAKVIRW